MIRVVPTWLDPDGSNGKQPKTAKSSTSQPLNQPSTCRTNHSTCGAKVHQVETMARFLLDQVSDCFGAAMVSDALRRGEFLALH